MPRKKLPPYARRLLTERRAGRHPLEVNFVYGERWWEAAQPKLCLKPCDYTPGIYDFSVLAGCRVIVLDQDMGAADVNEKVEPTAYGKFFDLMREIAAADACVDVEWPAKSAWAPESAFSLAFSYSTYDRERRCRTWPAWWSQELQDLQHRRFGDYLQDVVHTRSITSPGYAARS